MKSTCGPPAPSTVKMGPFSHATIILFPNVPTLSNVSELWSEKGHPTCAKNVMVPAEERKLIDVLAFCDENVARGEPGGADCLER